MVILLLIDGFLREYELKKQGKKQAEEILKEIESYHYQNVNRQKYIQKLQ